MSAICATVSSFTGLSALTYTERPSRHTLYSVGRLPKALMQVVISAALILREALQRSVVLFWSAAKPVPVPPPVTWILVSAFLLM